MCFHCYELGKKRKEERNKSLTKLDSMKKKKDGIMLNEDQIMNGENVEQKS